MLNEPYWVDLYSNRQYAVVAIIIKERIGVVKLEYITVAVIKIVSASIFKEGGAPKFLAARINHQIVIAGNKFIIPFSRIRFRVWDVS